MVQKLDQQGYVGYVPVHNFVVIKSYVPAAELSQRLRPNFEGTYLLDQEAGSA